jgi:hypothetical protein
VRYLVIPILFLIAGCGVQVQNEDWGVPTLLWKTLTPEEKAAYEEADRRKAAADQQQRWNAMIGYYAPFCEQLGFAADTDPWRNCVLQRLMADSFTRMRCVDTVEGATPSRLPARPIVRPSSTRRSTTVVSVSESGGTLT